MESAAGLGYLLAQQLVAAGETVVDVPPLLACRVRVLGSGRSQKNDPNDARSVAIAALRSDRLDRVRPDDHARVLALLAKRHRDMARLRNTHCTRLHALVGELQPGGIASEMTVTKANDLFSRVEATDEVTRCRMLVAGELIDDIARLDTALKASKKRVRAAVAASGTTLTDIYGVGPICAAMIIGHVRDVGRFPTKGHFATYNATAPVEASSGGRKRYRLNPRGNRKVNHALHVAAVCFTFTSFARPSGLWRWTPHDVHVYAWTRFASPVDANSFVVEQVFYPSTDATEVPMFLVRAATTRPAPDTPTLLTAYGGFAVSNTRGYAPGTVAFCEAGGLWAVAGIRGGGEYGEDWHRAGMLAKKQQCFDDFYAAADWLVAHGRTSRDRLAIRGGSNGGLLVGAALTQRPDLCRAAVCAVPLLDMLRYHLFLIGALWIPEYGDPDDPEQFAALAAYSPYHHVVDGTAYPATLITAAESDSRVDPLHARKFAARLQASTAAPEERPVLVRIETRAGHGVGKPAWKQADEAADLWAFVFWQLGVEVALAG